MALDRYIRTSLQNSEDIVQSIPSLEPALRSEAKEKARAELETSVALFGKARNQTNVSRYGSSDGVKSRELLLLAAEAALTNEHYEMARNQTHELLLLNPPSDQFLARALFVCAACDAYVVEEDKLNGSAAVRQRLKAVDSILAALDIAQTHSPRYDFLVYNASVHYWTVVRPLLRPGASRYLVPSMQRISDSLEALSDQDKPWRIVILIALAQAEDDAGNATNASQRLLKALELCNTMHEEASKQEDELKTQLDFSESTLSWCIKAMRAIQEGKQCEHPPLQPGANQSTDEGGSSSQPASASGKASASKAKGGSKTKPAGSAGGKKDSRGGTPKTPGGSKMAKNGTNSPDDDPDLYSPKLDEVVALQAKYEAVKMDLVEKLEYKKADRKATGRKVQSTLLQAIHVGRHAETNADAKLLFTTASEQLLTFPRGHGRALLVIQQTKSESIDNPLSELSLALDTLEIENFKNSKSMAKLNSLALNSTAAGNDGGTTATTSSGKGKGGAPQQVPPTPTPGGNAQGDMVELSDEVLLQKALTIPLESAAAELAAEVGLAALLLTNEKPEEKGVNAASNTSTNEKSGGKNNTTTAAAAAQGQDLNSSDKADIEKAVLLAHRCLSRAITSKDTTPTASIKMDFLKCQLMVLEFEGRKAVSNTELATGALRKDEGTKLVQFSMRQAALNSREGRGNGKEKKGPIDFLAEHAASLASQPLLDKLPESRVQALQLKQKVEALKLLERALLTCQRLDEEREKLKSLQQSSIGNTATREDGEAAAATALQQSGEAKSELKATSTSTVQAANIISPISKYEHGLMALATEGCVLVWNIAKPLLRSSLRKHAHRAMGLAAAYLANNHSPLQSLRASLHLELAKCEISTDFLAKAGDHLNAASLCDYGLIAPEEANPPTKSQELLQNLVAELNMITAESSSSANSNSSFKHRLKSNNSDVLDDMSSVGKYSIDNGGEEGEGLQRDKGSEGMLNSAKNLDEHGRRRKLDSFIDHTQLKLSLKKSIYEEPTLIEERALLIIEQAKEVTNLTLQSSLLTQAEKLLMTSPSLTSGNNAGVNDPPAPQSKPKRELEDNASQPTASTKVSRLVDPGAKVANVSVELFARPEADGRIVGKSNAAAAALEGNPSSGATTASDAKKKAPSTPKGGASVGSKSKGGNESVQAAVSPDRDWSKIPAPDPRIKMRAKLFSEIIEIAWNHPHEDTVPLVHKATASLLSGPSWNPIRYTSFVALQVRAQYVLAETYGCLVNSVDEAELMPLDYDVEELSDEEREELEMIAEERKMLGIAVEDCPQQLVEYKKYCVGALVGGIRRALLIATDASPTSALGGNPDAIPIDPLDSVASGEESKGKNKGGGNEGGKVAAPLSKSAQSYQYLVENGATALWNLHLPAFSGGYYGQLSDELVAGLEICERALLLVQSKNMALYSNIAMALANTLACRGREKEAETICRRAMLICRPVQAKPLVLLRASLIAAGMVEAKPIPGVPSLVYVEEVQENPPAAAVVKDAATSKGAAPPPTSKSAPAKEVKGAKKGKGDKGDKGGSSRPTSAAPPLTVETEEVEDKNKFDDVNKPVYDEKSAREVAKYSHFAVLGLLQEIKHIHHLDEREVAESMEAAAANDGMDDVNSPSASTSTAAPVNTSSVTGGGIVNPERRKEACLKLSEAVGIMDDDAKRSIRDKKQAGMLAAWLVQQRSFLAGGGGTGLLEAATDLPFLIVQSRKFMTQEEDEEQLEMRVEIWALLAAEALQQKDARLAQRCCTAALGTVGKDPSPELLHRVPAKVWRWRSVCERLWGCAMADMVSPSEQERSTQDELRMAAMEHFLLAANAALKANPNDGESLVIAAARNLWNVCLPMTSSPASRQPLYRYIDDMLQNLSKSFSISKKFNIVRDEKKGKMQDEGMLLVQLSVLLFECLADNSSWTVALKKVNEAFKYVPADLQRPLWQWRVICLSRLGRSALDGLSKMKESDPLLQARVWSALGHASSDRRQQLLSHTKALELLEKDKRPERTEFMLEFAEWSLSASLPRSDAELTLSCALDILLDIDHPKFQQDLNLIQQEEEKLVVMHLSGPNGGGGVAHSGGGGGGGGAASVNSGNNTARSSNMDQSFPNSARSTGSGGLSARSGSNNSTGHQEGRLSTGGGGSRSSINAGSSSSHPSAPHRSNSIIHGSGGSNAGGAKGLGGVLEAALGDGNGGGRLNAAQLDCTIRCLSMMSSLAPDFTQRRDYAMMASYYCERVVHLAIRCANISRAILAFKNLLPMSGKANQKASELDAQASLEAPSTPILKQAPTRKLGRKGSQASFSEGFLNMNNDSSSSAAHGSQHGSGASNVHVPTAIPFDTEMLVSCALLLGLDPKTFQLLDFIKIVIEYTESSGNQHSHPDTVLSEASKGVAFDANGNPTASGSTSTVGSAVPSRNPSRTPSFTTPSGLPGGSIGLNINAAIMSIQNEDKEANKGPTFASSNQLPGAPYFEVPSTSVQWSRWTPPDQLISALSVLPDQLASCCPNVANFVKLPITIHHLKNLTDILSEDGFHLQALPVTSMAELLVKLTTPQLPPLSTLVAMRSDGLRLTCGDNEGAAACLKNAPPIGLHQEEADKYLEEVDLIEQQNRVRHDDNESKNTNQEENTTDTNVWKKNQFLVRELWCELALECTHPRFLLLRCALEYLHHAARHNIAFKDHLNAAKCELVSAEIQSRKGLKKEAIQSVLRAQRIWILSPKFEKGRGATATEWATSSVFLSNLLITSGEEVEAERVLLETSKMLRNKYLQHFTVDPSDGELCGETKLVLASAVSKVLLRMASLYVESACQHLANASGCSGGARHEALNRFSDRCYNADACYLEASDILTACGPSLELVLAIAAKAEGHQRLLLAEALDKGECRCEHQALEHEVLEPLTLAMRKCQTIYRTAVPCLPHLYLPDASSGEVGANGKELPTSPTGLSPSGAATFTKDDPSISSSAAASHVHARPPTQTKHGKHIGLWPVPITEAHKLENALSPPISRALGHLMFTAAACHLSIGRSKGEHNSLRRAKIDYNLRVTDLVERWVDSTAPPAIPKNEILKPSHIDVAMSLATGAEHLLSPVEGCRQAGLAKVDGGAGLSLVFNAMRAGLLDGIWSTDTKLTARRKLTGLRGPHAEASNRWHSIATQATNQPSEGKKTKNGGKDAGTQHILDVNDMAEWQNKAVSQNYVSFPHFTFGVDERGDFNWQARVSLEAQAATLVQHGDWDAVSGVAAALIELHGCKEAAATAQWLLLYQSCAARRYLLQVLRTATKPISRLALLLDQLDPNNGAGSSGGGGGNGNEGEEFSLNSVANVLPPINVTAVEEFGGFLGRPWQHPNVQRAISVLSNIRDPPTLEPGDGAEQGSASNKKGMSRTASMNEPMAGHHSGVRHGGDGPVAWSMLDIGRPIPATLKVIPIHMKALVLQFSPHKDVLYSAIVSQGSLGATVGNVKHPKKRSEGKASNHSVGDASSVASSNEPSSPQTKGKDKKDKKGGGKESGGGSSEAVGNGGTLAGGIIVNDIAVESIPIVSKYEMPKGAWAKLVQLKRDFTAWRHELAKFLAHDVDISGGDYYENGHSADDILNEMFEHEQERIKRENAKSERDRNKNKHFHSVGGNFFDDLDAFDFDKPHVDVQFGSKAAKDLQKDHLEYQLLKLCERMDELIGPALGHVSREEMENLAHEAKESKKNKNKSSDRKKMVSIVASTFRDQKPMHPIDTALDALSMKVAAHEDKHARAKSGTSVSQAENAKKYIDAPGLMLLADTELLDLPLEMLSAFRIRNLKPKSRDFSAHVLANRLGLANPKWHASSLIEHEHGEVSQDGEVMELGCDNLDICAVVDPRYEDKPLTKSNSLQPASQKDKKEATGAVAATPTTETVVAAPAVSAPVVAANPSSAKGKKPTTPKGKKSPPAPGKKDATPAPEPVVEANKQPIMTDDKDPKDRLPVLRQVRDESHVIGSIAKTWTVVGGDDRVVGEGEWQTMLRERRNGGFVYYGPGNVMSHLPTDKLAGLDASGCRMVVLMDRMENEDSFRRKLKLDSSGHKSLAQLSLERPLETAALWTLSGVGSIVANQWAASFSANQKIASRLLDGMHNKEMRVGAALARATNPENFESSPTSMPTSSGGKRRASMNGQQVSMAKARTMYNSVLYGIPSVYIKPASED